MHKFSMKLHHAESAVKSKLHMYASQLPSQSQEVKSKKSGPAFTICVGGNPIRKPQLGSGRGRHVWGFRGVRTTTILWLYANVGWPGEQKAFPDSYLHTICLKTHHGVSLKIHFNCAFSAGSLGVFPLRGNSLLSSGRPDLTLVGSKA